MSRRRTIDAGPEAVWRVVADPHQLPRWWPGVHGVEDASPEAWTERLRTPRGKTIRADFTRVEALPHRRLVWRQEIHESPFERFLEEARTEISLEPAGGGATGVELRAVQRLRGLSRLGGFMVRRATRRTLNEALDGLERALGGPI